MSSSSTTNHLVNNQRNGGRPQVINSNGRSSSIAHIYQIPTSSASPAFQHNLSSQKIPQTSAIYHHIHSNHPQHPNHQNQHIQQQEINYLSKTALKSQESSVSAALHKLNQHHTTMQQQTNNLLSKQRTYSTSAISSVHTNLHNDQATNLVNHSNRIDDLSRSMTTEQHQQMSHRGLASSNRFQNQDQLDRDNEETTIKEEELENDLEGFKKTELESSLERNLPIELSFLIRQQAYCMARMNYLDRQIKELQEASQQSQPHQQHIDSAPTQVSSSSNALNQRFHIHHSHQQQRLFNAHGQAVTTTTSKNGNFILSDDSGGEYSRATISDDDELSSLLDQIAKSVRPDQQTVHHHQQAVPIFVMGSPIVPIGYQYYDDLTASVPAVTKQQFAHHHPQPQPHLLHHQRRPSHQQFDKSISAIEQLVSQREKNQISNHLNSADNWLKMRSKTVFNGASNNKSNGKEEQ